MVALSPPGRLVQSWTNATTFAIALTSDTHAEYDMPSICGGHQCRSTWTRTTISKD